MKRLLSLLLCAFVLSASCVLFSFTASADETVVYVKDGGTGDGSSASSPLGTLDAALTALASTGGTVKVVEAVTLAGNTAATAEVDTYYAEPVHTQRITITSADPASKAEIVFNSECQWYALSGPTTFENVKLVDEFDGYARILARGNHVTMGEGLDMYYGETLQTASDVSASSMKGFTVIGITNAGAEYTGYEASETKITVKSGVYFLIQANTRGVAEPVELTGNAYLEFLGEFASRQIGLASLGAKNPLCTGQAYVYWAAKVICWRLFPGYDTMSTKPFTANFILADGAAFCKDTDPTAAQTLVGPAKIKTLNIWHDTSASATALADHFKSTYTITQADGSVNQAALADYNGPAYRIPDDPAPAEASGTGTGTGSETGTGTGTETGTGTGTGTTAPNTGDATVAAAAAAVLALAAVLFLRKKARG